MKKHMVWMVAAALMLALAMTTGCGKDQVASPGSGSLSAEEQAKLAAERERRLREQRLREAQLKEQEARGKEASLRDVFVNTDIHFEYDRYDLNPEAKQILNEKVAYMQEHPNIEVIVEGHADERGSNSYNMALGEKRALAAAAYMQAMGITPSRIEVVSYGEERPLMMGTSEEAFAANRRAHFVIK